MESHSISKMVIIMAKNISKKEADYLDRLQPRVMGKDWADTCARRMERTLNGPPKHSKTRAYVATLPKRKDQVKVSPEEFRRYRAVAVRQLADLVAIEQNRVHAELALSAPRKARLRPRVEMIGLTKSYRERLFEAQDGLCGGCGFAINYVCNGTLDHVIPRALGGSNDLSNLLLMHSDCNNKKAAFMPTEFELQRNEAKNNRLGLAIAV